MTERLAYKLSVFFVVSGVTMESKRELLEYGIFHILSSIEQISLLVISGICFSVLFEIAVYSTFFSMLKRYIGGSHAPKHWICLWGFTAVALILALIFKRTGSAYPVYLPILFAVFSLILVLCFAPVSHPNNPKQSEQKIRKFRRKAIIITIIQFVAVCASVILGGRLIIFALCGSAGSLTASLTLLLPVPKGLQDKSYTTAGEGGSEDGKGA